MWQIISTIIVLVAPPLIILYDVFAYQFGGVQATISAMVQYFTRLWPELPAVAAAFFLWLWLHLFLTPVLENIEKRHPSPLPDGVKSSEDKGTK